MSLSSSSDKAHQKKLDELERQKKKSCKPTDNHGDNYVSGWEGFRSQGKGDRVRDITGWHTAEITERLRRIYGKDTKEVKEEAAVKKGNGK
tara:strand:- start:128 stop:400 length:273 start_codon:yes stop_codon:yes gene_type:complete